MGKDRREFSRVSISKEALFYSGSNEIDVLLYDMSEVGVAFIVDSDKVKDLQKGSTITFSFYDNYEFINIPKEKVIIKHAIVVRIDESLLSVKQKIVGCKILKSDTEINKYLDEKRVDDFIKNIHELNQDLQNKIAFKELGGVLDE